MTSINESEINCNKKMNGDNFGDNIEHDRNIASLPENALQASTGGKNSTQIDNESLGEIILNGAESAKLLGIDRRRLYKARKTGELAADSSEKRGAKTIHYYKLKNLFDFAARKGITIAAEKLEKYRTVGDSPAESDKTLPTSTAESDSQAESDNLSESAAANALNGNTGNENTMPTTVESAQSEGEENIKANASESRGEQNGTATDETANGETNHGEVNLVTQKQSDPTNDNCDSITQAADSPSPTPSPTAEERYQMLLEYLRKRFSGIEGEYYTAVCCKPRGGKFGIMEWLKVGESRELERIARAIIKANDNKSACFWIGNNLVEKPLAKGKRGAESDISFINVVALDIDSAIGAHDKAAGESGKPVIMPETIADCLKLMPQSIMPTFVNATGGGIQVFYMVNEGVSTAEQRKFAHEVGDKLKAIAQVYEKRHGYVSAVDGTADLPRVMRLVGTNNYKSSPRLCYTLQSNDCKYTLAELNAAADRELAELATVETCNATGEEDGDKSQKTGVFNHGESRGEQISEYDLFRARRMLEFLPIRDFRVYDEWLRIGMILHNVSSADEMKKLWRNWSAKDKVKFCGDEEIDRKWQSFAAERNDKLSIASLHKIANDYGYSEQESRQEFYDSHPDENTLGALLEKCPDEIKSLKMPFAYSADWKGISEKKVVGKRNPEEKYIPIAPLCFVSKIFRVDAGSAEKYGLLFKAGKQWKKETIHGEDLINPQKLAAILGRRGFLVFKPTGFCEYLAKFKARNESQFAEEKIFTATGWRQIKSEGGESHWQFIFPNLHGARVESDDENLNISAALSANGSADDWKQIFLKLCHGGGGDFDRSQADFARIRLVVGFALAAPVIRLVGCLNPTVHLHGKHGSGKSTLLKFAASIFGNPTSLYSTWRATTAYRNNICRAYADLPTIADDCESARKTIDFPNETYAYSLGKADEKARRDGKTFGAKTFRGVRVSTGERELIEPTDKSGANSRCVQFCVSQNFLSPEICAEVSACIRENYGNFAAAWLEHIEQHGEEISHKITKLKNAFDEDFGKTLDERHRLFLCTAGVAFYEFANLIEGRQSVGDLETITNAAADLDIIAPLLPTIDELDDCAAGLRALAGWLASHERFIATVDEYGNSSKEKSGRFCDTMVYHFVKTKCYGFVTTNFQQIIEGDCGLPSKRKFINDLKENRKLIMQCKNRNYVQKEVDSFRPCLYLLPESAFDFSADKRGADKSLGEVNQSASDETNHDKVGEEKTAAKPNYARITAEDIDKIDCPF